MKIQAKEYSVVEHLNKTLIQISILILFQTFENHKNTLIWILSKNYVPATLTGGEMTHMVGQVFEAYEISFHDDELPP